MTKTIYTNRNYKDELFKKIFSDKKSALELYNAIRKTNYTDESAITIHTLNQVIFLGIENDISFIQPERKEIFLSEAFKTHENSFDEEFLNLKAIMLNINYGYNQKLMELCKSLKEYSIFVDIVRKHQKNEKNSTIAAQKAVEECIKKKILLNILLREKGDIEEMIKVCYDEELHRKKEAEYNREQGAIAEKQNIAIKMHKNGMSDQQIITITGLDQETLDKVLI